MLKSRNYNTHNAMLRLLSIDLTPEQHKPFLRLVKCILDIHDAQRIDLFIKT